MWIRLAFLAVLFGITAPAMAAESVAVRSPRAVVSLVSDTDAPAPDTAYRLALRLRLAPGWHTYWKNPGDAGVAPDFSLVLPLGAQAGAIDWPVPERLAEGPIMTFGYSGEVLLPVTVTPGATPGATPGPPEGAIEATASWLVCDKICVPEEGKFHLDLRAGNGAPSREAVLFSAAERATPRAVPWPARIGPDGTLAIATEGLGPAMVADAHFFPEVPGQIDHGAPQLLTVAVDGIQLALKLSGDFKADAPVPGILLLVDAGGQRSAFSLVAAPGTVSAPGLGVWRALGFAFLGGLILNLMPCVFPVLAMKALGLIGLSGAARATARWGAAFYTLGVLAAFGVLGGVLMAARAAGAAAGWGFQFQSPLFVAAMAWLMFAIGLNLSGVFQFGGRVAGVGHGLTMRGGKAGYFMTGLLAAVVATPCTAPFMGAAIAAAMVAPPAVTAGIFAAMALGLAAPYVLLALAPDLVRRAPRPGPWMDVLKQALAFPMYGAAAWLLWVLSQSMGSPGVLAGAVGFLLVGFAAWALGRAQLALGARGRRVGLLAATAALLALLALAPGLTGPMEPTNGISEERTEPFSTARLAALRAEGRPVFVNMTAAWCITCLVNERIALHPAAVRAAFADRGVAYLKGDWTRQDPQISAFLRQHGRDGVPLYVFYPAKGAPEVLGQILTESSLLQTLARAGG